MSMTVQRRKDDRTPRVFMHKTADIRGGVSVSTSELGGDFLPEGAVLSKPADGISHVVKVAKVTADVAADATTITVNKGHNLKAGDVVTSKPGTAAYKITDIDSSASKTDTITLSKTLGVAIAAGGFIVEAAASGATDSALKYAPFAVNGTGKHVDPKSNLDTDAWLIGVTKGNDLPDFIASALTGIINY